DHLETGCFLSDQLPEGRVVVHPLLPAADVTPAPRALTGAAEVDRVAREPAAVQGPGQPLVPAGVVAEPVGDRYRELGRIVRPGSPAQARPVARCQDRLKLVAFDLSGQGASWHGGSSAPLAPLRGASGRRPAARTARTPTARVGRGRAC